MSEPLSCEERGGFCAVRTLSERCQNTVRTLSERCQNGQVSVRTSVGAPQTRFPASLLPPFRQAKDAKAEYDAFQEYKASHGK